MTAFLRASFFVTALIVLAVFPFRLDAFTVPPNDGFITDTAGILTAAERSTIAASLKSYKESTSNEIAVVILQSLEGNSIEDIGLQIGRQWGIGSTKNNGILVLVAYEDRTVRIDVGYGLEGALPDIVTKGIIDTDLVPAFRSGDYYGGISAAISSIQKHIAGEFTAERYSSSLKGSGPWGFLVFFGFVLFQWLLAILGRTKSWWLGGIFGAIAGIVLVLIFGWWISIPLLTFFGLFLDYIVSKNYAKRGPTRWWAGGGFGPGGGGFGGGGGGFGGFGGGSFGGGGASGRW